MGDMFRSEKMVLVQMFLQPDAAYATLAELGEAGCVQFHDLNKNVNAFQRKFVGEVRRCEELERQIRYIENECKKDGIKLQDIYDDDLPSALNPRDILELEGNLERIETELLECSRHAINMKTNYTELNELRLVLENTECFFAEEEGVDLNSPNRKGDHERGRLGFVAGVVRRERIFAFERMLWRISRGNIYLKQCEIEERLKDPITGADVFKTVFVVFYQGDQLQSRIKKICTGFHASMYSCPGARSDREDMLRGVRLRIDDLKLVIDQTSDHRNRVLVTAVKELPKWKITVKKAKAIYFTLNMFNIDVTEKVMIGEGWVPVNDMPIVNKALIDGSTAGGSTVPSFINILEPKEQPAPTFNRTNKFTRGFQTLIDAYGMATYREANPALYTCITFPFLFAVMFGDFGHGTLMFLFALWMVLWEESLARKRGGEIWRIFFAGRYIILLMGLYAMYTGFLYNDMFSKSLNVFGSHWRVRYNTSTVMTNKEGLQLSPKYMQYGVYPMGMDPIWQDANNKIIFLNTYKMKLSIIVGVLHMVFGVCMGVQNYVYFKRYYSIFLEFIPQVIFLLLFFGYLCLLMFWKWVQYSDQTNIEANTPGCAPSVLIMFINMVLFKHEKPLEGCKEYIFDAQATIQPILVVVAVICIPWMLLGKPIYIQLSRKSKAKEVEKFDENPPHGDHLPNGEVLVANLGDCYEEEPEDEPMSEIYIHQAIHTIEYVLSTISHTASYLRLWALSLAHAELSGVLWLMIMRIGLHVKGYVGSICLYFIFLAWALLTIAIMLLMEGLSAFLHTLRLHWVEFMSKFYEGAGYAFLPFSFKTILNEDQDD